MKIYFALNGQPRYVEVDPGESLADLLRRLETKSVKIGCDTGDCGSCTVLVDGRAVRSCLTFAAQVQGRRVLTVEGLGTMAQPHPLQEAFVEAGAVQCGFCIPGMVLVAYELLSRTDHPTEQEVREAICGNICRCTGYNKIVDAVMLAAAWKREGRWKPNASL